MSQSIESLARYLAQEERYLSLNKIQRGIEKECLRIKTSGYLSQEPHPKALGSALTHKFITTDYSEALLEFITPASDSIDAPFEWLKHIHQFVYNNIGEELLWGLSMPCVMASEAAIPIAQYGHSNSGKMKHIYRVGLGHRYGKVMQTIAGVHYNISFPTRFWANYAAYSGVQQVDSGFISSEYFKIIRNFHRFGWLVTYLFGASPALCQSFVKSARTHKSSLEAMENGTLYGKFATSLRMSDIGYSNNAQSTLNISYNSLEKYIEGLEKAIRTEEPFYKDIGVKVDDAYKQLNSNLLQIENEYYGHIRPKQTSKMGERPTKALANRGVEYIEVRALDLNPFSPLGVDIYQAAFLDCFLLYCLFEDSPFITLRENAEIKENLRRVVELGRRRGLTLRFRNRDISLKDFAHQILEGMALIAHLLDKANQTRRFSMAVESAKVKIEHPEQTLSGLIIAALRDSRSPYYSPGGFYEFAFKTSEQHKDVMTKAAMDKEVQQHFNVEAEKSHQRQSELEADNSVTFENYLAAYFE
ncbi:MAG: glutamate--cysteine ligase [Pseudomonadota bacterium]